MRRFGTILAERGLVEQDSGRSVRVSLGVPRAGTGGAEWECPFRIRGAGLSQVEFGYGEDSMQAIMNALEGIRALLDESGLSLGWKLGPGRQDSYIWVGETGFTRSIPLALGRAEAEGVLKPNMTLGLTAFGAGFVWGAGIVRWREDEI